MDEGQNQLEGAQTVILKDETLKRFRGGFTSIPNVILENPKLSLGARMAYAMLLKYAWQKDFCFPAQDRIAQDLGVSDRSVRTFLKELRESGFVDWKQRGLNQPNVYYILAFPEPLESGKKVKENYGPENISVPVRKRTSGLERKQASDKEYPEEEYESNVNVAFQPSEKNAGSNDAEEAELLDRITTTLGDRNPKSAGTFRRIIRTLGASITTRLLANTQEAYQLGNVKPDKLPAYFVGMAKNVAKENNLDLGFKVGAKRAEAVASLGDLKRQIGNRSEVNSHRSYVS